MIIRKVTSNIYKVIVVLHKSNFEITVDKEFNSVNAPATGDLLTKADREIFMDAMEIANKIVEGLIEIV